jgi:hypothetical protein
LRGTAVKLYHSTNQEAAKAILSGGFIDRTGTYGTDCDWSGVWLSNQRRSELDGAPSAAVILEVNIAAKFVTKYEWKEEGRRYREFLVPAATLNAHGSVRCSD